MISIGAFVNGPFLFSYRAYLLFKSNKNPAITNSVSYDSSNSLATATSMTLNQSELKDNLDGCAWSSDNKISRSALSTSNKCSHCRGNQKLSFRESNVYETSLKKFSTGQLVKYGFDNLNNAIKALEELHTKTETLKEHSVNEEAVEAKIETLFNNLNKISLDFEIFRNEFMPATYNLSTGYAVIMIVFIKIFYPINNLLL